MEGWVRTLATLLIGGVIGALVHRFLAPGTARRIRRDQERETALQEVVEACAALENQIDYMLSPERVAQGGVFQTNTMFGAEQAVREVLRCWRSSGAPFIPGASDAADAVGTAWRNVEEALGTTNPPRPEFFDRLRDLRQAASALRSAAQDAVMRPRRWRKRRGVVAS